MDSKPLSRQDRLQQFLIHYDRGLDVSWKYDASGDVEIISNPEVEDLECIDVSMSEHAK